MEITPPRGGGPRPLYHRDVATIDRESSMVLSIPLVRACSHSTGKQLSFALGTPIPLFLEVRNGGANFHPETIDIRLVRSLTTRGLTGGVRKFEVVRAVLWPARGCSLHSTKLWGEILLGKSLTPSFVFSNCSVRVSFFYISVLRFRSLSVHDVCPVLHRAISSTLAR